MFELKKIKNEIGCFDIRITTENAMFMMFFGGNGDLHWSVFDLENMWTDQVDIVITRENNVLYEIFSDLYNRVKECEIYRVSDLELDSCDTEEEKDVIRNRVIKKNNDVKKYSNYNMLFSDEVISWHSDEGIYDDVDVVNIHKKEDSFLLEFVRGKNSDSDFITIRFNNSGSTYSPFNCIFMESFNKLQEYEYGCQQTSLEEKALQKVKTSTK